LGTRKVTGKKIKGVECKKFKQRAQGNKKESKGRSLVQRELSQGVKPWPESSVAATVQALTL